MDPHCATLADLDGFLKALAASTGVHIEMLHDMTFLSAIAYSLAAVVGMVAHIIVCKPSRAVTLIRSKNVWLAVSCLIYTLGVGGFVSAA